VHHVLVDIDTRQVTLCTQNTVFANERMTLCLGGDVFALDRITFILGRIECPLQGCKFFDAGRLCH